MKEPKRRRSRGATPEQKNPVKLIRVDPKTDNQRLAFREYDAGQNLMLHGAAGSGKTLLSLYLGLSDIEAGLYKKMVIVRSAVPTRNQGFLPGSLKEKAQVYESPYVAICSFLYDLENAYTILKSREMIEFATTSYIRGLTLTDTVIVLDEIQNYTFQEYGSVITRVGENCRILCCGDYRQTDLTRDFDPSGIQDILRVTQKMPSFTSIEFGTDDILRSGVVREFILAKDSLGIT